MQKAHDFLAPTEFIDTGSPEVVDFVKQALGNETNTVARAIKIYYAVRDGIRYNPYCFSSQKGHYRASYTIRQKEGFCVQKALALTACLRAAGIPARVGFANVRNHLTTEKLKALLKGDLFVFHGYTQIFLNEKWVKATPAFDKALCDRFGVIPLDFDGAQDSLFHAYDKEGRKHMVYEHDYGTFNDFPFDMMISETLKHYPHLKEMLRTGRIEKPTDTFTQR